MSRSLLLPSLLTLTLVALPAMAAETPAIKPVAKIELMARDAARVAIVVNDAAVTNGDIVARYRLALLSSGLPDNPENRGRILPQIVRTLIEEQLQLQEARRQQIEVDTKEIDTALARMAQENNVPGGDLRAMLSSRGVAPRTLEQQTKAQIAWARLVQRQLRPRVEVSDDEVNDVVTRLQASQGKTEYFVNEIFLPVDDTDQDSAVRGFAGKLLQQIKQTGAFGAIARQFSQGAGATNGGEIGWVQEGTLAPELDAVLKTSKPGALLGPVKTSKGYHLLALRDARTVTAGGDAGIMVKIAQVGRGVPPEQLKAAVADAKTKAARVQGCDTLETQFPAAAGWQVKITPEQPLATLPPGLAPLVRDIKPGTAGELDVQRTGVGFFVLCSRKAGGGINREAIMSGIGSERLENLARALLRDLKRNAFIDVRI